MKTLVASLQYGAFSVSIFTAVIAKDCCLQLIYNCVCMCAGVYQCVHVWMDACTFRETHRSLLVMPNQRREPLWRLHFLYR